MESNARFSLLRLNKKSIYGATICVLASHRRTHHLYWLNTPAVLQEDTIFEEWWPVTDCPQSSPHPQRHGWSPRPLTSSIEHLLPLPVNFSKTVIMWTSYRAHDHHTYWRTLGCPCRERVVVVVHVRKCWPSMLLRACWPSSPASAFKLIRCD